MKKTPEQRLWSLDEIAGILQDRMTPVAAGAVIDILRNEEQSEREEREETARMERMIAIIDAYDELVLLQSEDRMPIKVGNMESVGMLGVASNYLYKYRDQTPKDSLDIKARTLASHIIATLVDPSKYDEHIVKTLSAHPLFEEIRQELLRQGFALKNKTGEEN